MSRPKTSQRRPYRRKVSRVLRKNIENTPGVSVRHRKQTNKRLISPAVTLTEPLEFDDLVPERGSDDEQS